MITPTHGVLTLTGKDKKGSLNLAIQHLRQSAGDATLSFDMMWVRVVGNPGGVMIRWTMTGVDAALPKVDVLHKSIRGTDTPPGMFVSVGTAEAPLQFDGVSEHLLVFRTDEARIRTDEARSGCHKENRRSLMHFFAILAAEDIDIAQYESVETSDGNVKHAMRLFDHRGRGKTWLINTVDRANRFSAVLGNDVHKLQIPGITASADSLKEATRLRGRDLHPISLTLASRDEESTFQQFIADCLKAVSTKPPATNGYITFRIHGPDVPGFLIACMQRVETFSIGNQALGARRNIVRACCRGMGRDGIVIVVAEASPTELKMSDEDRGVYLNEVEINLQKELTKRFKSKLAGPDDAVNPPQLHRQIEVRTDYADTQPITVVYNEERQAVVTRELLFKNDFAAGIADLVTRLSGQDANIVFLDARANSTPAVNVGCAIAVVCLRNNKIAVEGILDNVRWKR